MSVLESVSGILRIQFPIGPVKRLSMDVSLERRVPESAGLSILSLAGGGDPEDVSAFATLAVARAL